MVTFKISPILSSAVGRLGQVVFDKAPRSSSYFRRLANKRQLSNNVNFWGFTLRDKVATAAKRWKTVLTQAQRNAWNIYAKSEAKIMSGFNSYIRHVIAHQYAFLGTSWRSSAPKYTPPTAPHITGHIVDVINHTVTITYTSPVIYRSGARVRLWGKTDDKRAQPQMLGVRDAVQTSKVFAFWHTSLGGTMPADTTGRYIVWMDTVNSESSMSPKSEPYSFVI